MGDPTATTDAGSQLVERAARLAAGFAGASSADRLAVLRDDGLLYAPLPAALGGSGVDASPDLVAACERLARADATTAVTVAMHLVVLLGQLRSHDRAHRRGQGRRAELIARQLERAAWSGTVFAAASGVDDEVAAPARARLTADGEAWVVDGTARFPGALDGVTVLSVVVGFVDDDGLERSGFADVPTSAPGVLVPAAPRDRAVGPPACVAFRSVRVPLSAIATSWPVDRPSVEAHDRELLTARFLGAARRPVELSPRS